MGEESASPTGRAAVVSRHPATLRQVAPALGLAGLSARRVIGPAFLPRSARREFDVVVIDLDVEPDTPAAALVEAVRLACPEVPIIAIAGVEARPRLCEALGLEEVIAALPKENGWASDAEAAALGGVREHELARILVFLAAPPLAAPGPLPFLFGASPVEERLVSSSLETAAVTADVLRLAERLSLSEERVRKIELCTEELLHNAIWDAPVDDQGLRRHRGADPAQPVALGARGQVRLRFGTDGRNFVVAVCDPWGSLLRAEATRRFAGGAAAAPGLGLLTCFHAAHQLHVFCRTRRFTEVSAVFHISGSSRSAAARGSSLHLCFS